MSAQWIDFKKLRAELRFSQVLDFFGAKLSPKGDQMVGFCPLPKHNGKGNSPSFSAHPERGIFQCFGCGAKGNTLDFAILMRGGNPENGDDVRKAALELQNRFCAKMSHDQSPKAHPKPEERREIPKRAVNVLVNAPLDFALKGLDPEHPYLFNRGFSRETIAHFELGFCSRGFFRDRIVIPLHNMQGQLVGYSGRLVDDALVNKDTPKYLLPGKREHEGVAHEFHKGEILYNAHRIAEPVEDLIIVEGFTSVWWLWQHGYPNAVALMGSTFTSEQINLLYSLLKLKGHFWIMMDGDTAGKRCAGLLAVQLAMGAFTRIAVLADNAQPTDLSPELLEEAFPFGPVEHANSGV